MPAPIRPAAAAALDPDTCYRALATRDARFDGRFFVGVRTTGVFCRPICPARTPKRANVEFHPSAAAAFASGYRPCLRCRPERAPRSEAEGAPGALLVARALAAIDAGALDEASLEDLSARIGVTARHLRRLFHDHLGAAPLAVAQTRRLLFARQLIDETDLPLTRVAFAAGFASVRRFNAAVAAAYHAPPGALRRRVRGGAAAPASASAAVTLRLGAYGADEFARMLDFYRARAFPGIETVDAARYARSVRIGATDGALALALDAGQLCLTCDFPDAARLPRIAARARRMFDVAAPLAAIGAHLGADRRLRPALARGVPRVPVAWDPFELAVRAVLGQQVSVAAATTLAARLVQRFGAPLACADPGLVRAFPAPELLAALAPADLAALGIVRARAGAIIALARHVAATAGWREGYAGLAPFVEALTALPGIGAWTAQYVALRGFADPDAFPAADLGLLRAARALGIAATPRALAQCAERWRPWRAYAAQALWNFNPKDSA
ncbi:MAG: DNA-3-methyladenine glycosylase 2 family protein [Burkholderiales bacterium]|nr:DNA-3-methyladenine glycosylase 2 family protein [Burkholderiales bacterium]